MEFFCQKYWCSCHAIAIEMFLQEIIVVNEGRYIHSKHAKHLLIWLGCQRHYSLNPIINPALIVIPLSFITTVKIKICWAYCKFRAHPWTPRYTLSCKLVACTLVFDVAIHHTWHCPIDTKENGCYWWACGASISNKCNCSLSYGMSSEILWWHFQSNKYLTVPRMAHYLEEYSIEPLILAWPLKKMTLAIENCWIANQMASHG